MSNRLSRKCMFWILLLLCIWSFNWNSDCFALNVVSDGIRSLDFGEDPKSIDIYGMVSGEGERVALGKNLKARGNVESWLTSVEQNMVASMRRSGIASHFNFAILAANESTIIGFQLFFQRKVVLICPLMPSNSRPSQKIVICL